MISKKLHLELIKKWSKIGKVYQGRTKRVMDRLKWFDRHLSLLDGKYVLEVGCNAGLMAVDICKHADIYVGLEKKKSYFSQALCTAWHIINDINPGVVWFYNMKLSEYVEQNCETRNSYDAMKKSESAIVLSRVLYYLKDKDIEVLKGILENCKVALVFCGSTNERKLNKYGFHKAKNTKRFFEDNGFKFEVDLVHSRYFGGVAVR